MRSEECGMRNEKTKSAPGLKGDGGLISFITNFGM